MAGDENDPLGLKASPDDPLGLKGPDTSTSTIAPDEGEPGPGRGGGPGPAITRRIGGRGGQEETPVLAPRRAAEELERERASAQKATPENLRSLGQAALREANRARDEGRHADAAHFAQQSAHAHTLADALEQSGGATGKLTESFLGPFFDPFPTQHREIAEAQAPGYLPSPRQQTEELAIHPSNVVSPEPREGPEDIAASMAGSLPYFELGGMAGEEIGVGARALARTPFSAATGARTVGEAIGRATDALAPRLPEQLGPRISTLAQPGSRLAEELSNFSKAAPSLVRRGMTQGQVVGAALVYRDARNQGASPEEAAHAVLQAVPQNMAFGVASELGFTGIYRATRTVADAANELAQRAFSTRPTEQADALSRMAFERDRAALEQMQDEDQAGTLVGKWQQIAREARVAAGRPLDQALANTKAEAEGGSNEAKQYVGAINDYIDAIIKRTRGEELTTEQQVAIARARDNLNTARKKYGGAIGAAAITGLAANDDDLTDDEKKLVGLAGIALGTEEYVPPRMRRGFIEVLDRLAEENPGGYVSTGATPHQWRDFLTNRANMGFDEANQLAQKWFKSGYDSDHPVPYSVVREAVGKIGAAPEEAVPFVSRLGQFLKATPAERKDALGKAWNDPRPAADWIGKLKNLPQAVKKEELALILPDLEAAKAENQKLSRADVQAMVERRTPRIERVLLQNASDDLPDIENDLPSATAEDVRPFGDIRHDDPNEVGVQLAARRQLLEQLHTKRSALNDALETPYVDADVGDVIEEHGESTPVISKHIDERKERIKELNEQIESAIERQRARAERESDKETEAYNALEALTGRHAGLTAAVDWINENSEPDGSAPDIGGLLDDLMGHVDTPDYSPRELLDDNGLSVVQRDDNTFAIRNRRNNAIVAEGPDREELMSEYIDDHSELTDDLRDRQWSEIRDALQEYAWKHQNFIDADSTLNYYEEGQYFDDERSEIERHEEAIKRLREHLDEQTAKQGGEDIGAKMQAELTATERKINDVADEADQLRGELEGHRLRQMGPGPVPQGSTHYETYQTTPGDKRDYSEILNVWANNPATEAFSEDHWKRHGYPDVQGHVRASTRDIVNLPDVNYREVSMTPGEPESQRLLKSKIIELRKLRDVQLEQLEAIHKKLAPLDAIGLANLSGDQRSEAEDLAQEWTVAQQRLRDLGSQEDRYAKDIAKERGISMQREAVRNLEENQADPAQIAVKKGLRRPPASPETISALREKTIAAQEAYRVADRAQGAADDAYSKARVKYEEWRAAFRYKDDADMSLGEQKLAKLLREEAGDDDSALPTPPMPRHIINPQSSDYSTWLPYVKILDEHAPPEVRAMIDDLRETRKALEAAARETQRAHEVRTEAETAIARARGEDMDESPPPSPFITGGDVFDETRHRWNANGELSYRLNAMTFLADAVVRGVDRISWQAGVTAAKLHDFSKAGAAYIYDGLMKSAIQDALRHAGITKMPPIERYWISGMAHWSMQLTPEIKEALKKFGVPTLGVVALAATAHDAEAQDTKQGDPLGIKGSGESHYLRDALATTAGLGIAAAGFTYLANHPKVLRGAAAPFKAMIAGVADAFLPAVRQQRLSSKLQPATRAARIAIGTLGKHEVTVRGAPRDASIAFPRREPTGTEYTAPVDVTETKSGKGPALFNVGKIGLSPSGEQVWRDVIDKMNLSKHSVSWAETAEEAAKRATDPNGLLDTKPWTGAAALAARVFQRNAVARLETLANERAGANPARVTDIDEEMGRLTADIGDMAARASKEREMAGRTLNAYKIVARSSLDEATWGMLAQRAKQLPLSADELLKVKSLIGSEDRLGLARFVAGLRTSSNLDKALAWWKTSLLGISTVLKVGTSHAMELGADYVNQPIAVGADALIAMLRGTAREKALNLGLGTRARGFVQGAKEGVEMLKQGSSIAPEQAGRFDIKEVHYDNPFLEGYVHLVHGVHNLAYRPFRIMQLEASLDELAKVEATKAVKADPSLDYETTRAAIRANPTNEMAAIAIDRSERSVFQNKGTIAELGGAVTRKAREKGGVTRAIVETAAPFVRIPANLTQRAIDTSPIGFATAVLRQIGGKFDQARFSEDIARAFTGSAGMMALGYYLASMGDATGDEPTDPAHRNVWELEGKQAHSVKIGGRWWNIAQLGPQGMTVALGAQLHNLLQTQPAPTATQVATGMLASTGKTMLEQPFLRGIFTGLQSLNDPARQGETYLRSQVGSAVPSMVSRAARAVDPVRRAKGGVVDELKSRIPGLSKTLPAAQDAFGQEIRETPTGQALAIPSPVSSRPDRENPIAEELDRLNVGVPSERGTGDAKRAATAERGPLKSRALSQLVASPSYDQLDDVDKRAFLKAVISTPGEAARANIVKQFSQAFGTEDFPRRKQLIATIANQKVKQLLTDAAQRAVIDQRAPQLKSQLTIKGRRKSAAKVSPDLQRR